MCSRYLVPVSIIAFGWLVVAPANAQTNPPEDSAAPPEDSAAPPEDSAAPPDDTAAPPDDTPVEPGAAQPDPRDDAAWSLYHQAFAAAIAGDRDRAMALRQQLIRQHPTHPAAAQVIRAFRGIDTTSEPEYPDTTRPDADQPGEPGRRDGAGDDVLSRPERPTTSAQAELALFQTLNGIALGIELCIAAQCDSGGAAFGLPLLGGTAALAISLGVRDRVTPGRRALINSGALWGAYNAALLIAITEPEPDTGAGILAISQVGGVILGQAVSSKYDIREGQVAAANTGATWGTILTFMAAGALDVELDSDRALTMALVAADVGFFAGAGLYERYPTSRGRTLLIDAGGILGALMGSGVSVLIGGDDVDTQLATSSAFVGTSAGLLGAAYISRNWDRVRQPARPGDHVPRMTLLPTPGGGLSVGLMMDLDL